MKITVFLLCLNAGGAERVAVHLAHDWLDRGHEVEMVTIVGDDWPPRYSLDPRITHVKLDLFGDSAGLVDGIRQNMRRVRALRRHLRTSRPDVVVAQLTREIAVAVLATRGLAIPVVGHFHSNVDKLDPNPLWRVLERWAFGAADRMVFLTEPTRMRFSRRIQRRGVAIANPVDPPPPPGPLIADGRRHPNLVAVGGLREVKNHDRLIQAFAQVSSSFPDWRLRIIGEGELRPDLERLVSSLGLDERVEVAGFVPDLYGALRGADLFVLASRWEGFSMALCEAMACGLPVITTDSSDGQRLIVRHEVDGLLVPPGDIDALAGALRVVMGDAGLRARMGRSARDVVRRFSSQDVFRQWDLLLASVVGNRRPGRETRPLEGLAT